MERENPGDQIAKRLGEAIDQLHQDVARVEVWAGALSGFAQPVPQYDPDRAFLLPRKSGTNYSDES